MSEFTTLGGLLPLIVFHVSAGLVIVARFCGWTSPETETPLATAAPPNVEREALPLRERAAHFARQNRWGLILASVIALILLFVILFAPPRLTGDIPAEPNKPGRPFFSLHWQRDFVRANADDLSAWSGILSGLACVPPIIIAIRRRSRLHAEIALLLASISVAILAQWLLANEQMRAAGATLYVMAALGFLYWAWLARSRLRADLDVAPVRRGMELPLLLFLLILTTFGRFYALTSVPYGIEGDEAKWTSEAVNLGILGKPDTSGEYHRDALPVSFYLQTPFHEFFGPSQMSARFAVAFLSVLASLVFYWLLRQLAPMPFAALATFLLAVSIFDISASRLANVESFVKIGAILPLALLAYALNGRPWQAYALAGLTLALAALTYDTLWPMIGVCLILFLVEIRGQTIPVQEKVKALTALFAPTVLALPFLIPYFDSRINYYELEEKGWSAGFLPTVWEYFVEILNTWFIALRPDFLYNRAGPLLNAALLPWLVVGTVAAILLVRVRGARWILVWVALVIFPVPILANSPMGRVYYPAVPAIYALVALGMYLVWKEIGRIISAAYKPLLTVAVFIPLVWLPFANYYIYFNEVSDSSDRQMRREIGEIMAESADPETFFLLAVIPGADEPLNNEIQMMDLFLLENLTPEQVKEAYEQVSLEDILAAIPASDSRWKTLVVILDKTISSRSADRAALKTGLQTCYPDGILIEGKFFDRYLLDESARQQPACSPVRLTLLAAQPPELYWKLSGGAATFLNLLCERQALNYLRIEAETFPLGPGWHTEINFATDWSGAGFLLDFYGSQPLPYSLETPFENSEIYVWVRSFKRAIDDSPAYLAVNDVSLPYADTGEAALNQWVWERLGPFPNIGSTVRITIARPYHEEPAKFMALFTDLLLVTDDPTLTPDSQLKAQYPAQGFMISGGNTSGTITPTLPAGQYSCRLELRSSQPLVDSFGRQPVYSNEVEFHLP